MACALARPERAWSYAVWAVASANLTAFAGQTIRILIEAADASTASLVEAAVIANAASAVVVAKVGTATASAEELKALLPEAVEAARSTG